MMMAGVGVGVSCSSSSCFSRMGGLLFGLSLVFFFSMIVSPVSAGVMTPKDLEGIEMKKQLCPELVGRSRYSLWSTRYDNETQKCFPTGQRGPCGKNMIFYSVKDDSVFGECDCNYDIECKSLIYSPVFKECVYAYEQGHCNEGYWLVADKEGKPSCERNLCRPPPKYSLKYQWSIYKGRCERLYQPNVDCKPDEMLWIPKGYRFPICGKATCSSAHAFVPQLECELGSKLFHEDRCTRRKGL